MKNLLDELFENFTLVVIDSKEIDKSDLHSFLYSSMDENRIKYSTALSKKILRRTDTDDAEFFRINLLRREITQKISYARQRDHTAHTLYNYLLGKYIFNKSKIVKDEISRQFEVRNIPYSFDSIWPFTSLIHDIGYLFEGSIEILETDLNPKLLKIGTDIFNDYFSHKFWLECGIDAEDVKKCLLKLAQIDCTPKITEATFSEIINTLRSLGDLSILFKKSSGITNDKFYSEDIFDLWFNNYKSYNNDSMANRIHAMKYYFFNLVDEGFGKNKIRLLDHAVISGFLIFLYSTFYFKIHAACDTIVKSNNVETDEITFLENSHEHEKCVKLFLINENKRARERSFRYDKNWWWRGIIWASASVALHQFLQDKSSWPASLKKLRIEEDAMTYLQILVDILQEWDRYTVSRESVISGKFLIQGNDMKLGTDDNIILISYPKDATIAEELKLKLSDCLEGWDKIIKIEEHNIDRGKPFNILDEIDKALGINRKKN